MKCRQISKVLAFVPLALVVCIAGCSAPKSNDPDELALELMKVSGAEAQMEATLNVIVQQMPPEDGNALKGMIDVNELMRRLIPIYKKHFTADEMNDMIDFYKSDTGKKIKELGPTLVKESGEVGQKYVQEKMAALGVKDTNMNASLETLKQIGTGLRQYLEDDDFILPPMKGVTTEQELRTLVPSEHPRNVQEALIPYMGAGNEDVFVSPRNHDLYQSNASLSNKKLAGIPNPAKTITFFETSPAPDGSRAVLFLDGQARRISEQEWQQLR